MRDAAVPEVLHDETTVLEGVDMIPHVYPPNLGHLGPLLLIVGPTVSLADKHVVVVFSPDEPEIQI